MDNYSFDRYYSNNLDNSVFRSEESVDVNFENKKTNTGKFIPEVYSTESEKVAHTTRIEESASVTVNKSILIFNFSV